MIYVASSWRNLHMVRAAIHIFQAAGLEAFDFTNGSQINGERKGFHWQDIDSNYRYWSAEEYLKGLNHPLAVEGFKQDFEGMEKCDTCVLVLPSGRSSHLELGWFVGQGKKTAILLDQSPEVELMYRMVDLVTPSMVELLGWLGVSDTVEEGAAL